MKDTTINGKDIIVCKFDIIVTTNSQPWQPSPLGDTIVGRDIIAF